jgi:hypothetical protein
MIDGLGSLIRLGRNLKHLVTLLEEFLALGITFVSLNEGIDATTPADNQVFVGTRHSPQDLWLLMLPAFEDGREKRRITSITTSLHHWVAEFRRAGLAEL